MRCPSCKKNEFRSWEGPLTVAGVEVLAYGMRCGSCDEVLFDAKEVARQELDAAAKLVQRGVRTGAQFKFVRKVAGLKATDVAEILDVAPKTITRWESGEVEIPRAIAFALGELYDRPRITREKLEAFAR